MYGRQLMAYVTAMRGIVWFMFAIGALLAPLGAAAQVASDYAPFYFFADQPRAALLNGEIDFRAPLAFKRLLRDHPNVDVIVLNSNGGSVQAALLVAEDIYERRMKTAIAEGSVCASACSFVFFAGRDRVAGGQLGVHQISGVDDVEAAQLNLSDVIETLSRYDVSPAVITKMLRTPPGEMYFFTPSEVASLGINRVGSPPEDQGGRDFVFRRPESVDSVFSPIERVPIPERKPTRTAGSLWAKSRQLVIDYLNSAQGTPSQIAHAASTYYAPNVMVNGVATSRTALIVRLVNHAKTWPERRLELDEKNIIASCQRDQCTVSGTYFYTQGDGKSHAPRSGVAFNFVVDTVRLEIMAHTESAP